MNLSKIHHIAIIVSDYEAAKDFYDKIIFCEIKRCSAVTESTFLRDKRSY